MRRSIVVTLCGPHDDQTRKDGISFRRINRAIEVSLQHSVPIIIAGDAYNGADLQMYENEASCRGVSKCIRLYDARANTLADVQSVVRALKTDPEYCDGVLVHLVTDNWHMLRATTMLKIEALRRRLDLRITCVEIVQESLPPARVLEAERLGTLDFLEDHYGNRAPALSYGKPATQAVEEREDESNFVPEPLIA